MSSSNRDESLSRSLWLQRRLQATPDDYGKLLTESDNDEEQIVYTYGTNDVMNSATIITPSGKTLIDYNVDGQVSGFLKNNEKQETFQYDGSGNLLQRQDANGHVWKHDTKANTITVDGLDIKTMFYHVAPN